MPQQDHDPTYRRTYIILRSKCAYISHGGDLLLSLFYYITFTIQFHIMLTGDLYSGYRYQLRYLTADTNPHLFPLYYGHIGPSLQTICRILLDPLKYFGSS